jgi:hypothetical protein
MTFTSGKFVYANYTTVDQTEKYREIYGDMLGCGNSRCTSWASLYDSEGGINDALRKCCGTNSSSCQTGGAPPACPSGYTLQRIKYVDYVDSQLMDYGSTVRQCRQLVDVDVCTHECMKGSTGVRFANVTACNNICRQNINIPWYCANYTETNTTLHQYDFANLNKIFEGVAKKTKGTLGLQQDYEKTSYGANFVEVNADSTYLGANDILCFSDKIKRWVVYRPLNATANETIKEERKSKVGTAVTVYEQTPR